MGLFESRRDKLAKAAVPLGLALIPAAVVFARWPFALRERAEQYRAFHRIKNPFGGMLDGAPLELFDLEIDLPESSSSTSHHATTNRPEEHWLVAVSEIALRGPAVSFQPRGLFGRLGRAIGAGGMQLGVEEFDKSYHIVTNDQAATRQLITQDLVAWLIAERPRDLRVELAGGGVLVARQDWGANELVELVTALRAARALLAATTAAAPSAAPVSAPSAGAPAGRFCTGCGAPLAPGAAFCGACGARAG